MPRRTRPAVELLEGRLTPATFTVTTLADAGPGSLRDALTQANAAPDPDTIVFAPALAGGTVGLSTVGDASIGPSALFVATPVEIDGTGQTITRTAGADAFRLFAVGPAGALTLRDLTLSNGLAQGGAGSPLNVSRGEFDGGGGAAGLGGAVYNQGSLGVFDATLTGNRAVGGSLAGSGQNGGGLGGPGVTTGGPPNGGGAGGPTQGAGNGGFGGGGQAGGPGGFVAPPGSPTFLTPAVPGGSGGFGGGGAGGGYVVGLGGYSSGDGGFGGGAGDGGTDGFGADRAGAGMGGAVFNQGGAVVLGNTAVTANVAVGGAADVSSHPGLPGGFGFGGGVFNLNGAVTLANATFTGNTVARGDGTGSAGADLYNLSLNALAFVGGPPATPTQTATVSAANSTFGSPVGGPDIVNYRQDTGPATITGTGPNVVAVAVANTGGTVAGVPFTVGPVSPPPVSPPPVSPPTAPALVGEPTTAVGSPNGTVQVLSPAGAVAATLTPFPGFGGEVRTAVGGNGVVVAGTGPGVATAVTLLDSATGATGFTVAPFEASFTGGVFVSAGDLFGTGTPDVIVSPDEGGGPRVQIRSGTTGAVEKDFYGIDDPNFRGGARTAVADITGDGVPDLIVAAGFGGGPRVTIYDGAALRAGRLEQLANFFVFEQSLRNGVFVAAGDVNGDGRADLIAGGGPGGGPRVLIFSGQDIAAGSASPAVLANFFAGDPSNRGGVRVAAKDLDGDQYADLLTAPGPGGGAAVSAYAGKTIAPSGTPPVLFAAPDPDALNGAFVG